jgi:hypothetical protein
MTEYQRVVRMPTQQPQKKVVAEIASEMKCLLYLEKKKCFVLKQFKTIGEGYEIEMSCRGYKSHPL